MPSTRTICYYAMYVIGEVESNWNWTAVNYNDPITIGMMQWYGTRAAALLTSLYEMPDSFVLEIIRLASATPADNEIEHSVARHNVVRIVIHAVAHRYRLTSQ